MQIVISGLFVVAMFLAWAIGGEYRFGKGKRGLLLAIPMALYGIGHMPWWLMVAQAAWLYAIYQCLFYDDGISLICEAKDPRGWLIVMINGAMIGLTGAVMAAAAKSWTIASMGIIAGVLGFLQAVELSNEPRFEKWRTWLSKNGWQALPYKDDQGHPGHYINFKDAWWVCEGLVGGILGLTIAFCAMAK